MGLVPTALQAQPITPGTPETVTCRAKLRAAAARRDRPRNTKSLVALPANSSTNTVIDEDRLDHSLYRLPGLK
jgi:hypothetical protein